MRHFKRLTLWLLVIVLGCSTVIACLDPSYLRDLLSTRIALYTGRALRINGPVVWRLRPLSVVLELYDVQLANAPSFAQDFLSFKKASIQSSWKSLLFGPLSLSIDIDGLDLTLARTLFGQSNWDDLRARFGNTKAMDPARLLAHTVRLRNSTIRLIDPGYHQNICLKNLNLDAQPSKIVYAGIQAFYHPLNLQFDWNNLNHPEQIANISLETQWRLQSDRAQLDFKNMVIKANLPQQATMTMHADLHLRHLQSTPRLQATVHIMNIPLSPLLRAQGWDLIDPAQPIHLHSTLDYQYPTFDLSALNLSIGDQGMIEGTLKGAVPSFSRNMLEATGLLRAKHIHLAKMPIESLESAFSAKSGLASFEKLRCVTAGIQHQGRLDVDFRTEIPRWSLSGQSRTLDLRALLTALHESPRISGSLKASSTLETEGNTLSTCLENIQGHSKISLKNGKIYGIALMPLLEQTQGTLHTISKHLLEKKPVNIEALLTAELGDWRQQAVDAEKRSTPFDSVEAQITFSQGTLQTDHFNLYHPRYKISGKGVSDLKLRQSDYETFALLTPVKSDPKQVLGPFLERTPLSIQIKGPLNALIIRPELGLYAHSALQALNQGPSALEPPTMPSATTARKATEMETLFGTP